MQHSYIEMTKVMHTDKSGPICPQSSLWWAVSHCGRFLRIGPILVNNLVMILLPSHSHKQWGQLGEILGGVRVP